METDFIDFISADYFDNEDTYNSNEIQFIIQHMNIVPDDVETQDYDTWNDD